MIIDFESMPETVFEHFNGGEKYFSAKMYNDGKNRIFYGKLIPGASIGLHRHDASSETIYILSGSGTVLIDGGTETVTSGSCHHCPLGSEHSLINSGSEDLVFFAVVPTQEK